MSHSRLEDALDSRLPGQRKATLEITASEPQFAVRYVGKTEVYVAVGQGCTQDAVQRIWDNCFDERGMARVGVLINSAGIRLGDDAGRRSYRIQDIAYCSAERRPHDRVFSWICRDPDTGRLECHAVLCASPERAQLMALMLHRAFHAAYKDWKRAKERRARHKAAARGQIGKASTAVRIPASTDAGRRSTSGHSDDVNDDDDDDDDDKASGGSDSLMESIMAQMNIVEEEEISLTDNTIGL